MPARPRSARELTLGFLTLGAQPPAREVLRAAADAGFGAAGLRLLGRHPGDGWPHAATAQALASVAAEAARLQVRISSVSGYYLSAQAGLDHLQANIEAARAVGAPLIAQGCFDPDPARVCALLRDYAAQAASAGLRIALEFMPMSTVRSLPEAMALIEHTGAGNLGLLVDALHLFRSGAGPSDLAALDPSCILLTQLCDAPAQRPPGQSLYEEAMSGRLHLGDGALDLAGLVAALPFGAEIELETPVVAEAGLSGAERAQRAAGKAQAFFRQAFSAESP